MRHSPLINRLAETVKKIFSHGEIYKTQPDYIIATVDDDNLTGSIVNE
jgi:hypothetical protein